MEKKRLQIENFIFTLNEDGDLQYIEIKAVSGLWSTRFNSGCDTFYYLSAFMDDEGMHQYIHSIAMMMFIVGNSVPDLQFIDEFAKSYMALTDRVVAARKKVSDEEDAQILAEEKELHEMKGNQ